MLLVIILLTGCQGLPVMRSSGSPCSHEKAMFIDATSSLLCYYRAVTEMPEDELSNEFRYRDQAFKNRAAILDRLRLALLLSLPDTSFYNPSRAAGLLEEYMQQQPGDETGLGNLAFLLHATTKQQHTEMVFKQEMEDKWNQKQARYRALLRQLEGESQRSDQLQEQINALKQIDSTIDARKRADRIPATDQ